MGALEIILLLIGIAAMILGFVLPVKQGEGTAQTKQLAETEIKELVSQEMKNIRNQVDEVMEESVTATMEKTERSLERLTNEKIMAVSEYSDTVLQEINRNHNEVMFLYDMLNDKHQNIKNTMQEVNKTVKEVAETQKEVKAQTSNFHALVPEIAEVPVTQKVISPQVMPEAVSEEVISEAEISAEEEVVAPVLNSNERILELHAQGMDKVDIARELGLGVGEVKLVIDLFKNI